MSVVPVRAALTDREPIREGFTGRDAGEADSRYSIHLGWQNEAVPVDRGDLSQAVGDAQRNCIALSYAQERRGHLPIDCGRYARGPRVVHRKLPDLEIEIGTTEFRLTSSLSEKASGREHRHSQSGSHALREHPARATR